MQHHVFHIVAASGDVFSGQGVIGKDNGLPWPKFSGDLKFFKATTVGSTIIMGHKTFESIQSKPLPHRENFVLSRSKFPVPEGVTLFHSVQEAVKSAPTENVFIVGGADLYRQTLENVEGIFLTQVPGLYPGSVKYPPLPESFRENNEKSKELRKKFNIPIVYLENTAGTANLF